MLAGRITQVVARQFTTSTRRAKDVVHPDYPKLRLKQEHYQKEDGNPVHLKNALDGILYRGSAVLVTLTSLTGLYVIYDLGFGKK